MRLLVFTLLALTLAAALLFLAALLVTLIGLPFLRLLLALFAVTLFAFTLLIGLRIFSGTVRRRLLLRVRGNNPELVPRRLRRIRLRRTNVVDGHPILHNVTSFQPMFAWLELVARRHPLVRLACF